MEKNHTDFFLNFNKKIKLIIFGNKNLISNNFLEKYSQMISFVHCEETIADNDAPSSVLRSKKNSSMRKAIEYIKPKKTIFTHMTALLDEEKLISKCPKNVLPAFDGMEIEI